MLSTTAIRLEDFRHFFIRGTSKLLENAALNGISFRIVQLMHE